MNKMFFKKSLVVILGLFLFSGTALAQINWTPPTGLPTGNNVPAPVNVGGASQTKEGNLSVKANFSSGEAGTGGLFSNNQSYLKGMTIFQEKDGGLGPNFLASFITSAFYNDVFIGDGVYTNPDLELQGRFKYVTKDDNGNIINPLNLEEMQDGGFDRILIGDENGNLRWGTTADILDNGGVGGGDLPTCADGQIIQYNNGVWGCVDPSTLGGGGGGNLPNGTYPGTILVWDAVSQQWQESYRFRVDTANSVIEIDLPNGIGNYTTKINSNSVKIPLGGTAAPGKILTAVDAQGTLGWAAVPTNDTADLPLGVGGQTLWFNGITNAWEATDAIKYINNQETMFVVPNAYLQKDLYLKDIKSYDTDLNPQAPSYLPRMCVDKKGVDGIAGTGDDGKVYICPGENGFVYATPTLTEGGQGDEVPGNPLEITTNGSGGTAGESVRYEWTVPAGINMLKQVSVVSGAGGGGGGGSGTKPGNQNSTVRGGGGGGGGGSGYKHTFYDVPVTPGQILCLVVGKGGEGGVGVSAYRNRSYNSTVLGVTSPDGDQLKAYPGQNGGDSYIAESDCNTVLSHNSLNLHVKGGGGGQGGYSKAPAFAARGALGGEGGWAGYLVSNPGFQGYAGFFGSDGETTEDNGSGGGGAGGPGGSDSLTSAFGGVGGIVANTYHLRDINRNGNYTIGGNAGAEKAKSLPEHGKDYNQVDYDSHPGGGGGGGAAPVANLNVTYDPPPTLGPGSCDDGTMLETILAYVHDGNVYELDDYVIDSDILANTQPGPGFNAVQWFFVIGVVGGPFNRGCNVEIVDPGPYTVNSGNTYYRIDWNGDGDEFDTIQSGGVTENFGMNSSTTYNTWAQQLKNAGSVNLTDAQIDKYVDNLCLNNIANGLSSCGADGGRGGDGRIYIQY